MTLLSPAARRALRGGAVVALGALALVPAAGPAAAAGKKPRYTFAKIADGGGVPSINGSGRVAYTKRLAGADVGVFTSDGSAETTIWTSTGTGFVQVGSSPSVNDAGQVAFVVRTETSDGDPPVPTATILRGDGATLITIAGPGSVGVIGDSDVSDRHTHPLIDASGTVYFHASLPNEGEDYTGIYKSGGGGLTPVALNVQGGYTAGRFAVSPGGTVAYVGTGRIYSAVFVGSDDVADDEHGFFDIGMFKVATNASGAAAFLGFPVADPLGAGGIYAVANGSLRTVAVNRLMDSRSGFESFGTNSELSMNAAGTVVFQASRTSDASSAIEGIYTGPDAASDKVVAPGDKLFGSVVRFVRIGEQAINDAGQVAFLYGLTDGTSGIAVATPTQQPVVYGLARGDVADSAKPDKDKVALKGTFPAAGSLFDPAQSAASFSFGDPQSAERTDIAAHDAGWKGKNGKWTWKSAKGAHPKVVLAIDAVKGTFSLTVSSFSFAAPPPATFLAALSAGGISGSVAPTFDAAGTGKLRYRAP